MSCSAAVVGVTLVDSASADSAEAGPRHQELAHAGSASDRGISSIYLQGIDNAETIDTANGRRHAEW